MIFYFWQALIVTYSIDFTLLWLGVRCSLSLWTYLGVPNCWACWETELLDSTFFFFRVARLDCFDMFFLLNTSFSNKWLDYMQKEKQQKRLGGREILLHKTLTRLPPIHICESIIANPKQAHGPCAKPIKMLLKLGRWYYATTNEKERPTQKIWPFLSIQMPQSTAR